MRNQVVLLLAAMLAACAPSGNNRSRIAEVGGVAPAKRAPVTILVSIDGFRADYLDRGVTPNLSALAAAGISAAMRPSFPSVTFPNHWTLVTGKVPDRNGIVGNVMQDPRRPGERFTMQSEDPFWWNEAEPIWVTAERGGIRTATVFWPGSTVAWGGRKGPDGIDGGERPSDWLAYAGAISDRARVDTVIDWLRRPDPAARPRFVTVYFDVIDHVGHASGPDAPEVNAALATLDVQIGRLRTGLDALGQPANLVIVADHGMAAVGPDRVVVLDRVLPAGTYSLIGGGPFAGVEPLPGQAARVTAALAPAIPHIACWPRAEIPPRLRFGTNRRVPPIVCLADDGWLIVDHAPTAERPVRRGGAHGYDPATPAMAALFIAAGPAISPAGRLAPFDNVDIAPLLRRLLGLPEGTGLDGSDRPFRAALRGTAARP